MLDNIVMSDFHFGLISPDFCHDSEETGGRESIVSKGNGAPDIPETPGAHHILAASETEQSQQQD